MNEKQQAYQAGINAGSDTWGTGPCPFTDISHDHIELARMWHDGVSWAQANSSLVIMLGIYRADEVAECLSVSRETYEYLWNEIVPLQSEEQCQEPGVNNILDHWVSIPEHIQLDIAGAIHKATAEFDSAGEQA